MMVAGQGPLYPGDSVWVVPGLGSVMEDEGYVGGGYSVLEAGPGDDGTAGESPRRSLAGVGHVGFRAGPRDRRDSGWIVAYVALAAVTLAGGLYGVATYDRDFRILLDGDYLARADHCYPADALGDAWGEEEGVALSLGAWDAYRGRVMAYGVGDDGTAGGREERRRRGWPAPLSNAHLAWFGSVTVGASLVSGVAYLDALKKHTRSMIFATLAAQVGALGLAALVFLAAGVWPLGLALLLAAVLVAGYLYARKERLELTARIVSVSAEAFRENPSIMAFVVALNLAVLLVVAASSALAVFGGLAGRVQVNGAASYEPNPEHFCHASRHYAIGTTRMVQADCCTFEKLPWVPAYLFCAAAFLAWTTLIAYEMRMFVIGGSVAEWYFNPMSGLQTDKGQMAVRTALGHAVGPQFGTVAACGFVLMAVRYLRSIAQKLGGGRGGIGGVGRGNARSIASMHPSIAPSIALGAGAPARGLVRGGLEGALAFAADCVLSLIEGFSKFVTIRCAVTGESFFEGASATAGMAQRHDLKALVVDALAEMAMGLFALVIAVAWGGVAYLVLGPANVAPVIISSLFVLVVLGFFSSVLLNIVDTVFVCYLMDLDAGACQSELVHEVFASCPIFVAETQSLSGIGGGARPPEVDPLHPSTVTARTGPLQYAGDRQHASYAPPSPRASSDQPLRGPPGMPPGLEFFLADDGGRGDGSDDDGEDDAKGARPSPRNPAQPNANL